MTDTGITELPRQTMYGAQHPIIVVPKTDNEKRRTDKFIVSGHCCESGDILTPKKGDPEALEPRMLLEPKPGDLIVVGGSGAYCSGMSMKNYNSYTKAQEVLIEENGSYTVIRKRQTIDQIIQNEV